MEKNRGNGTPAGSSGHVTAKFQISEKVNIGSDFFSIAHFSVAFFKKTRGPIETEFGTRKGATYV